MLAQREQRPRLDTYSESYYWEQRYNEEREQQGASASFEWYCDLAELWPLLESHCGGGDFARHIAQCLVVGCGSSTLPFELHARGITNILSIDRSPAVVSFQSARHATAAGLEFAAMDARKLDRLPDDSFDLVLDKACLDAIFCSFQTYNDVLAATTEICRVLRPAGRFVCVSHGSPGARLPHLGHPSLRWTVEHSLVPTRVGVHVYVCTKIPGEPSTGASTKGAAVEIGAVEEEVDPEWERRKLEPSGVHFKDRWTPGHVRLARVRDQAAIENLLSS